MNKKLFMNLFLRGEPHCFLSQSINKPTVDAPNSGHQI